MYMRSSLQQWKTMLSSEQISFIQKLILMRYSLTSSAKKFLNLLNTSSSENVLNLLLTNQFTGAWTHYTDTVSGIRTDHMVESFQRISIEYAHSSINHTIYIGIRVRQQVMSPNFRFRLFNQCRRDTAFRTPTSIVRPCERIVKQRYLRQLCILTSVDSSNGGL